MLVSTLGLIENRRSSTATSIGDLEALEMLKTPYLDIKGSFYAITTASLNIIAISKFKI